MGRLCLLFVNLVLITLCVCETDVQDRIANEFVNHLHSVQNDQTYEIEDIVPLRVESINDNTYYVETRLSKTDRSNIYSVKKLNCTGTVTENGDGSLQVQGASCVDFYVPLANIEELVTDVTTDGPIQLENEVQPTNSVTSGEQFIAVPRQSPAPCIGCSTLIDTSAAGVTDLASLGVLQLDRHEPNVRHTLTNVVSVERQVQVVGGVRYIMILNVDYDNCTLSEAEDCRYQKTCQVSILEKPWKRLADGSKFRAILSNNCTEEWLFGDNGSPAPIDASFYTANTENNDVNPTGNLPSSDPWHKSDITENTDGENKAIHLTESNARPTVEKTLTDEQMKELEEQIIPLSQLQPSSSDSDTFITVSEMSENGNITEQQVEDIGANKSPVDSTTSTTTTEKTEEYHSTAASTITVDKQKAIDELMNFFDFAGAKSKVDEDASRIKRDFGSDLEILSLVENYENMKYKIKNARFVHKLAQAMVNYLNDMDIEIKTRILKDVLGAEEEFENDQRYFYVKARVAVPCDKVVCETKYKNIKVCNAVLDMLHNEPSVLYTYCHNENKQNVGKVNLVPRKDPVLRKLVMSAVKKINAESNVDHAIRLKKIIHAITQKVSGILTKATIEIEFINCNKSTPYFKRVNCTVLTNVSSKICDIEIHEKHWLNEQKITYTCSERPSQEILLEKDDQQVTEILKEAMQYLDVNSNRKYKQKFISLDHASTSKFAVKKTKVVFVVGYTECTDELQEDINSCKLLNNEPLRNCTADLWERPLLDNDRQMNVQCKDILDNTKDDAANSIKRDDVKYVDVDWPSPIIMQKANTRKDSIDPSNKRVGVPGGIQERDPKAPEYLALAKESATKFVLEKPLTNHHEITSVEKVTYQVVAGSLTRIDYKMTPTNCLVDDEGKPTSSPCVVQDGGDVLLCHSKIWEQPWLNKKEITVNCDVTKPRNTRQIGQYDLVGGFTDQDPKSPKFMILAEESVAKYVTSNGLKNHHMVIAVDKVSTQVVSGSKTIIDFKVSPTDCLVDSEGKPTSSPCVVQNGADVFLCHSEIWEQSWLNKKEITKLSCARSDQKRRRKRSVPGGEVEKDINDTKYLILAEESAAKYVTTNGLKNHHKVIAVIKVTYQTVAGSLTKIDFRVSPTDCLVDSEGKPTSSPCVVQNGADVFLCHSEIWERPWLNKKEITKLTCARADQKRRRKRSVVPGGVVEEDLNDTKYLTLAEESAAKYVTSRGLKNHHTVINIDKVTSQVVSGSLIKIDFKVSPTNCVVDNEGNPISTVCVVQYGAVVLGCHSEIWDRPWLKSKEINVTCSESNGHEVKDRRKRNVISMTTTENVDNNFISKSSNINANKILNVNDPPNENSLNFDGLNRTTSIAENDMFNTEEYRNLAEQGLRQYEVSTGSKYRFNVVKILYVTEHEDTGVIMNIHYLATQITCNEDTKTTGCDYVTPSMQLTCISELRFILSLDNNLVKHIKTHCKDDDKMKRRKRQIDGFDDYVEDDVKYAYADRAINRINSRTTGENLYKLITIHDVRRSEHMKRLMVRMYIEIAKTFCMHGTDETELSLCNEMAGHDHLLCHVRIFPSRDDELVIEDTSVVCEDDLLKFSDIAGFNRHEIRRGSVAVLNRDGSHPKYMVAVGEDYLVPSLDFDEPMKFTFVVLPTNCSKAYAESIPIKSRQLREKCPPQFNGGSQKCTSQIFMTQNTRMVKYVNITCFTPNRSKRQRRSIPILSTNATEEEVHIQKLVKEALAKLEDQSVHPYKQRVLMINSYSTKITTGKLTTIDFELGYTSCLKYEWIDNITSCEFLEHLPRRHCITYIWERLWVDNGRKVEVVCDDDETPLEANMEFDTAESATALAEQAIKRIEYKYPHPLRQKVVRIFSLEKQMVAGLHYRIKLEVGYTNCSALSEEDNCQLEDHRGPNKFCRVNVWLRSWTTHPPSYRVTCDYAEGFSDEIYHTMQAEILYQNFLSKYKPDYINNYQEIEKRFKIFKENVKKIHELNVYEQGTARYAITKFADLSEEEFRRKYLGLNPKLRDENQVPMAQAEIPAVSIPEEFDWRKYDAVTGVKDQGQCGSCWAFSVTGNIEGQWKKHSGKLVSLSEQELLDCDTLDQGCSGGLPDNAYRAIEQIGGLELEKDYPYEADQEHCDYNATLSRVQISGAVNISSNESDMAKWLVENGPISIGINANGMQFYMGGISHPWRMLCDPKNLDHGVLIVGYGIKDYPVFKKKIPYWIVKNSWGALWGEGGYYRVFRGDGTCGLNMMASSAVI